MFVVWSSFLTMCTLVVGVGLRSSGPYSTNVFMSASLFQSISCGILLDSRPSPSLVNAGLAGLAPMLVCASPAALLETAAVFIRTSGGAWSLELPATAVAARPCPAAPSPPAATRCPLPLEAPPWRARGGLLLLALLLDLPGQLDEAVVIGLLHSPLGLGLASKKVKDSPSTLPSLCVLAVVSVSGRQHAVCNPGCIRVLRRRFGASGDGAGMSRISRSAAMPMWTSSPSRCGSGRCVVPLTAS